MALAGAALQALAARHVHLGGNEIAFLDTRDLIAKRDHLPAKLVPWNQRWMNAALRPTVPVVNVKIGAANRCNSHLHQHVATPERGNLHLAKFRARRCFWLDHRQHC